MPDQTDPAMKEWITLLEVATNYMVAAEALIEGLQGKLGAETYDEAAVSIKRRVTDYMEAREAFSAYARERQEWLP